MTSKKDNFNPDEPGIIAHSQVQVLACVPFVRPRSLVRHLARHLARRPNFRDVARLTKQVLLSASFTAGGILALQAAGFNLIDPLGGFGAFLALTGAFLAFSEEDTQTPEEYRQFVISHFEKRGETPPRWTLQVQVGQVWRHRIT